jgi:hypothetical protein
MLVVHHLDHSHVVIGIAADRLHLPVSFNLDFGLAGFAFIHAIFERILIRLFGELRLAQIDFPGADNNTGASRRRNRILFIRVLSLGGNPGAVRKSTPTWPG